MTSLTINCEKLEELMYFGKTYCKPNELLERTVAYRKFKIPHEVLLDEGAIMYSLNWLFQYEALEYLEDFPKTRVYDKTGRETVYMVELSNSCINITSPLGSIVVKINPEGLLSLTSYSDNVIPETLRNLFGYEIH